MKNILLNVNEIESCWETIDICFIKMNSGRIWLCTKPMYKIVKGAKKNEIIEVTLASKGKCEQ